MSVALPSAVEPHVQEDDEVKMEYTYSYSEYSSSCTRMNSAVEPEHGYLDAPREDKDDNRMSIVFTSSPTPEYAPQPTSTSPLLGLDLGDVPIPIPPPAHHINLHNSVVSAESQWTTLTSTSTSTTRAVVDYIPNANQNVFGYGDAFSFLGSEALDHPSTGTPPHHHHQYQTQHQLHHPYQQRADVCGSPYSIPPSAPSFSLSTYQSSLASSSIHPNNHHHDANTNTFVGSPNAAFIPNVGGFCGLGVGFVRSTAPPPSSTYSIPSSTATPLMQMQMPEPSECGGPYSIIGSVNVSQAQTDADENEIACGAPSPVPLVIPMPRSLLDSPPPLPIRPPPSPGARSSGNGTGTTYSREGRSRNRSRFTQARNGGGNRSRLRMGVRDGVRSRERGERYGVGSGNGNGNGATSRTTSLSFLSSMLAFPRREGNPNPTPTPNQTSLVFPTAKDFGITDETVLDITRANNHLEFIDHSDIPKSSRNDTESQGQSQSPSQSKKIGTGCGPGAMPPPPTPASPTPSVLFLHPRAQAEKSKVHSSWLMSTSVNVAKEGGVMRNGLRRRRKSRLGWLSSPGRFFAAVLPSSSN